MDVFQKSYQARHIKDRLKNISLSILTKANDKITEAIRNIISKRDPNTPISISAENLSDIAIKKDIFGLGDERKRAISQRRVNDSKRIGGMIAFIKQSLEGLYV